MDQPGVAVVDARAFVATVIDRLVIEIKEPLARAAFFLSNEATKAKAQVLAGKCCHQNQ
jgi:hypothetical protein